MLSRRIVHSALAVTGLITLALFLTRPSAAAEKVRVGKAVATAFTFTPLDIGIREGIFAKYGLDVQIINFTGDAKLQQGLASDAIDFGLGSGPGMAFAAKGVPVRAVADYFGAPANICVTVKEDSPIKKVADLKGKVMAVSTVGSLTYWLTQRISLHEGWGPDGIKIVATGGGPAMVSAILTGGVDAGMGSYETALTLQEKGRGRPLVTMDKFVPRFITHVIFARKPLIDQNPQEVGTFVKAFFAVIDYMRTHRDKTIEIADDILHDGKAVMTGAYDREMPIMSKDGTFDPVALKLIKQSWVELKILDKEPSDDQILTRRFVPVKLTTASGAN
ncbi:MAG TPA: ABC transporter substrate-binding protein [Stellaceae bacterium]|nr:ABC transporter substrate-binding protein [Stellaceae bacterium]